MPTKRDRLPLQEQIIVLLCFDAKFGKALAAQLRADFFDGTYRDFVAKVLLYRKRHGKPPGVQQTRDLAEQAFSGKGENMVTDRLVPRMIRMRKGLHPEHIAARVKEFTDRQSVKLALVSATDRWEQDDDLMVKDVRKILKGALSLEDAAGIAAGLRLDDPELLEFTSRDDNFVSLGIPQLDRLGIGLTRKEMLLYIGPKGTGKTWFCTHCGKMALLQRMKVLHVSLEMGEQKIGRRYLQSLFAVARSKDKIRRARLLFEDDNRFRTSGFKVIKQTPKLAFSMGRIRRILRRKQRQFGSRIGNLIIKEFPSGTLTMEQLEGYLDYMQSVHEFTPDLLIVDYPDLMAINAKTQRQDIGRNFVDLRGLAQIRNMALVTPTQGTRQTIGARRVRSTNAAEDISKVLTADTTLAYSRTEEEESLNLGRLSVEHTRDSEGQILIALAQNYAMGQYVTQSALMGNSFWDQVKELRGVSE